MHKIAIFARSMGLDAVAYHCALCGWVNEEEIEEGKWSRFEVEGGYGCS